MHTYFAATAATIFSRVSAPPPPLIIAPCAVVSSAPSIYTGSESTLASSTTGIACLCSRSAVLIELATAPLMRPLMAASSSMKKLAVEPLPTPM